MNAFGDELPRGVTLQLIDHIFHVERMARDDHMYVTRQYRTGPHRNAGSLHVTSKSSSRGPCLAAVQKHWWIFQRRLGIASLRRIVLDVGNRSPRFGFGGVAKRQQFPRSDEFRPRSARV